MIKASARQGTEEAIPLRPYFTRFVLAYFALLVAYATVRHLFPDLGITLFGITIPFLAALFSVDHFTKKNLRAPSKVEANQLSNIYILVVAITNLFYILLFFASVFVTGRYQDMPTSIIITIGIGTFLFLNLIAYASIRIANGLVARQSAEWRRKEAGLAET